MAMGKVTAMAKAAKEKVKLTKKTPVVKKAAARKKLGQYRSSERDALFSLKNLRTLVLSWYYYDQDPNDILAHMERLERIDYGIHSGIWGLGYDPTQYERCDRGSRETSIVPASEVRWWQGAEEQWWEPNNLNRE